VLGRRQIGDNAPNESCAPFGDTTEFHNPYLGAVYARELDMGGVGYGGCPASDEIDSGRARLRAYAPPPTSRDRETEHAAHNEQTGPGLGDSRDPPLRMAARVCSLTDNRVAIR